MYRQVGRLLALEDTIDVSRGLPALVEEIRPEGDQSPGIGIIALLIYRGPRPSRSPRMAARFVMWRMTHRFQREVDQAMRQLDLTHLQFTVLAMAAWTNRGGNPVVQAEIARFGDIHPMQLSLVLKALERKGMIRRARRRGAAKVVSVTCPGLEVLRAAMPLAIAVQRRLFGQEGRPGGVLLETLLRIDRRQK